LDPLDRPGLQHLLVPQGLLDLLDLLDLLGLLDLQGLLSHPDRLGLLDPLDLLVLLGLLDLQGLLSHPDRLGLLDLRDLLSLQHLLDPLDLSGPLDQSDQRVPPDLPGLKYSHHTWLTARSLRHNKHRWRLLLLLRFLTLLHRHPERLLRQLPAQK
jgi:hypothetical protein